ncbi:MAG: hypothetical protein HC868_00300 [Sphingomonadales bacterium]|nr:hypothetical protein [Sphingomonadales bacterium]
MDEPLAGGKWFAYAPDELVATFFLVLPEPVALPVDMLFVRHSRITHAMAEQLLLLGESFYWELFAAEAGQLDAGLLPDRAHEYLVNKFLLASSTLFRRVPSMASFSATLLLADHVAESGHPGGEASLLADHIPVFLPEDVTRALTEDGSGVGSVSIAEVSVPVRILLSDPLQVDGIDVSVVNLQDDVHRDVVPREPAAPDYLTTGGTFDISADELASRVSTALYIGVAHLRELLSSYYIAMRHPLSDVTVESLHPLVPLLIRSVAEIQDGARGQARLDTCTCDATAGHTFSRDPCQSPILIVSSWRRREAPPIICRTPS